MPPQIGEIAPDFELLNQNGQRVRLSDYRGQKVLLFVFPKANTAGCNAQACGLRDEMSDLGQHGVTVLGLSADTPEELLQWQRQRKLGYDLLSDPDHTVLRAWGVEKTPLFGFVQLPMTLRSQWLIGPDGRILAAEVGVNPWQSAQKALEAVQAHN